MRVVVFGSRSWKDVDAIRTRLHQLPPDTTVTYGAAARGADKIAEYVAFAHSLRLDPHPAEWKRHGGCRCRNQGPGTTCKFAGIRRNLEMLDLEPELAIGFWDGRSPGSRHMIDECRRRGIPVEVVLAAD